MPPKKQQAARSDAPPPLPSRDHFERAHFAVQASVYLQQLGGPSSQTLPATATATPTTTEDTTSLEGKGKSKRQSPYARLARSAGNVKPWAVHNQVKIDPSFKHILCSCNTVLIPGLTARVRIRPSKAHANAINTTCLSCNATHVLPAAPTSAAPESGVDGAVRQKRRDALRRRAAFHVREAPEPAPEPESAETVEGEGSGKKDKGKGKENKTSGHVLWRGNEKVRGWGVVERESVRGAAAATEQQQPQQQPAQKKQKQSKQKAQPQPAAPSAEEDDEEAAMNM